MSWLPEICPLFYKAVYVHREWMFSAHSYTLASDLLNVLFPATVSIAAMSMLKLHNLRNLSLCFMEIYKMCEIDGFTMFGSN